VARQRPGYSAGSEVDVPAGPSALTGFWIVTARLRRAALAPRRGMGPPLHL